MRVVDKVVGKRVLSRLTRKLVSIGLVGFTRWISDLIYLTEPLAIAIERRLITDLNLKRAENHSPNSHVPCSEIFLTTTKVARYTQVSFGVGEGDKQKLVRPLETTETTVTHGYLGVKNYSNHLAI